MEHLTQTSTRFVNLVTYVTPWGRDLLEKIALLQLVKKFAAFYGTYWFGTVFPRTCHEYSPHPHTLFLKVPL
jgi:hypothetical protein